MPSASPHTHLVSSFKRACTGERQNREGRERERQAQRESARACAREIESACARDEALHAHNQGHIVYKDRGGERERDGLQRYTVSSLYSGVHCTVVYTVQRCTLTAVYRELSGRAI